MVFGNWEITEHGIRWHGDGYRRFEIPADELNTTIRTAGAVFYQWILLATDEDWLTEDDLIDLDYAFVYAIAKFDLDFSYVIFDDTLAEQYDRFDAEDSEEYDF